MDPASRCAELLVCVSRDMLSMKGFRPVFCDPIAQKMLFERKICYSVYRTLSALAEITTVHRNLLGRQLNFKLKYNKM